MNRRLIFLVVGSVLFLLISPFFGGTILTPALFGDLSSPEAKIFFELRVPRLILTLITGGILAMLGATYQSLFRNPLAEPYVLGIANAVTLGFALSEFFFQVSPGSQLSLFCGILAAFVVTLLLMAACLSSIGNSIERILLFGMGLQFTLSSALFVLLSYHSQKIGGGSLRWFFGQLPWCSLSEALRYAAITLPPFVLLLAFSRHLDALSLGDGVARTLGFSPVRTRNVLLLFTSVLIGWVVSIAGTIGFVGLVVPNAIRLFISPSSNRALLVQSFLVGALYLEFADILSRSLTPPFEFPIGVITTLIGGPLFIFLLWGRK